MPAVNNDPSAPTLYRVSGDPPYASAAATQLPASIAPRQVTLRDRVTVASLIPFSSATDVPRSLLGYLCDQLNKEIEKGDTYPMIDTLSLDAFGAYWFANFGAVMLLGNICSVEEVNDPQHWEKICLGSFNIKPNYPGRSSHVCNGMFIVTDASRNRGVGRLMGEGYLEWAPLLGYTYSVFNLVYETNVASCRIWDALGFKRIGKVPGCGQLRSYPNQMVDAIIYGRDLGSEGEDFVSEERFDKIRFYLKHGKYPTGADRAEKSRLRSAATHYKLIGGENGEPEKLMLKDKEVVSDPQQQYEIARRIHVQHHGGINKTTATIALKYHWVRIKETVSMVIKNCPKCNEAPKTPLNQNPPEQLNARREKAPTPRDNRPFTLTPNGFDTPPDQLNSEPQFDNDHQFATTHPQMIHAPVDSITDYTDLPLDPQIMDDIQQHLPSFHHHNGVDPYGQNTLQIPHGLPHDFDHTQMHHHGHSNEYKVMVDEDEVMASQAAAALREQSMHLVDASQLNNEHLHHDLLSATFTGRDDGTHFDH